MNSNSKKAFTLIELLVVIAIIALLLSILMPALSMVKKQAETVMCRSNLKQWGIVFTMYTVENGDYFPQNYSGSGLSHFEAYWCHATMQYYEDKTLRFCPSVKRNEASVAALPATAVRYGSTRTNWGPFAAENTATPSNWWDEFPEGSYGMNEWCSSPVSGNWAFIEDDAPQWWRKISNVSRSATVPIFMDCKMTDVYPRADKVTSPPPAESDVFPVDNALDYADVGATMNMITMDRHNKGINSAFVDGSARKVDLKELWKLKWNPEYNTSNIWTKAGGVTKDQWPEWMQGFKEY